MWCPNAASIGDYIGAYFNPDEASSEQLRSIGTYLPNARHSFVDNVPDDRMREPARTLMGAALKKTVIAKEYDYRWDHVPNSVQRENSGWSEEAYDAGKALEDYVKFHCGRSFDFAP
jgi:hypothetical protein